MSADNWAICPRCLDRAYAEWSARLQVAADAYGKVPPDEYERLRSEALVPIDEETFRTFREDYEFYGAKEGTIKAVYKGRCQTCDVGVEFEHAHPFYEPTERVTVSNVDRTPTSVAGEPS